LYFQLLERHSNPPRRSSDLITREARDAAGDVHDRKPAFLPGEKLGEWLRPGKLDPDERADLHAGLGEQSEQVAGTLVTHPLDRADRKSTRLNSSYVYITYAV